MIKKTVLNTEHRKLGAKMVDFGGWDMPLHYGSQIEEHLAVRKDAGMFDVSHMCALDLAGSDAPAFLQKLLANNIDKLKIIGKALYSAMLNDNGGVIDDLIVYKTGLTDFRIVVNAGTAEKDIAWMSEKLKQWDLQATLEVRRDLAMIAVQGPNAKEKFWQAFPNLRPATEPLRPFFSVLTNGYFISTTGYTGETGFELAVPEESAADIWNKLLDAGIKPIGLGARDTLRLEAGMNLYGQDMDEDTSPLDAGLAWTIDLESPRDFVGKNALLKNGQSQAFLGLLLQEKGVLRAHQSVTGPHGSGEITSGTFSPSLQKAIALARLPIETKIGEIVEVNIRGKAIPAKVTKPTFVRNGSSLVSE